MSTVFTWEKGDFEYLLRSCENDDATPYILKYMPKSGKIVEAGCGLGRYVKYLSEKGYDVEGIEYSGETVSMVKEKDSSLKVIQADVLSMPYQANSIGGIVSLGVVEHFIPGPFEPLKEMHRVLNSGGIAVISVPSFNLVRRIKRYLYIDEICYYVNPISILRRSNIIRKLLKKKPLDKTRKLSYNRRKSTSYVIYPTFGDFFEYRFRKNQFEDILVKSGFTIIESVPIGHMDGIYHEFGRLFTTFKNWEFHPNIIGKVLNTLLSKKPFCHNHMHLCVVRKG
jgi:SAM-dependent methyltransferase